MEKAGCNEADALGAYQRFAFMGLEETK